MRSTKYAAIAHRNRADILLLLEGHMSRGAMSSLRVLLSAEFVLPSDDINKIIPCGRLPNLLLT